MKKTEYDPKARAAIELHYVGHAPAVGGRVPPMRECQATDCEEALERWPILSRLEAGTAKPTADQHSGEGRNAP